MNSADPTGSNWTDEEIDLTVADYMEMLKLQLAGIGFVKSHRNEVLRQYVNRSRGSIEFKHQNISAVLEILGFPTVAGYRPRRNFQRSLIDGVERYLTIHNSNLVLATSTSIIVDDGMHEAPSLFMEPPPMLVGLDQVDSQPLQRLARKFDPAKRDARNRQLGLNGEDLVFQTERSRLRQAGREDLARKVEWTSQEHGDGAGYDIRSFNERGNERFLEVKTTIGNQKTPFFISENERSFSEERPDAFRVVRLYDFASTPRAFQIKPPLESALILTPTNYRASF